MNRVPKGDRGLDAFNVIPSIDIPHLDVQFAHNPALAIEHLNTP